MAKSKKRSLLLRFAQQYCLCQLPHSLPTSFHRTRAQTRRSSLVLQDNQTPALTASPSQAPNPRGSGSGGVYPNVASTSRIPLGVALDRSSPSDPDPILVESCFDDEALVSGPSGSHDFKHCSAPDQHPLVARPSVIPTSSGATLSCVEIPQACNEGTARGSAPPRGPSRVLHLDLVTSFLGIYQPFVDSVNCHTHPTLVHYPDFNNTASCPMLADDLGHTRDI